MKRFLIINTSYFGDTVLAGSLCRNIKSCYPDSHVTFMVNKPFYELVKYMDGVDEVYVYDKFGENKGIQGFFRFIKEHKCEVGFDASFVLYGNERGIILSKFLKAKKIYSDNKSFIFKGFLDNGNIDYNGYEHVQDKFAYLFELYSSKKISNLKIKYNVPKDAKKYIGNMLKNINKKIVIINATTKNPKRDMQVGTAIKLIDKITSLGMQAVMVGAGKIAEDYYLNLPEECKRKVFNCINKTSISQLGALLQTSELLISQETGTMHFALALDVPVVAICHFNSKGHLAKWAPKDIYCSKLVSNDFSAEHIWKCAEEILKDKNN